MLLIGGLAVGGYFLYQKQASATPFTWLPVVQTTPTGPVTQQQAGLIATGISLLPKLGDAAMSLINSTSSWFGSSTVPVGTLLPAGDGVLLPEYQTGPSYEFPLNLTDLGGGYSVIPMNGYDFNLDYGNIGQELPAGYGVLSPEYLGLG